MCTDVLFLVFFLIVNDFYSGIQFIAVIDNILCPTGRAVPESEYEVRVFDNLNIPFKRSGLAVFGVFRQELCELDIMGKGLFFSAGIAAFSAAGNDFGHVFGEIIFEVIDGDTS